MKPLRLEGAAFALLTALVLLAGGCTAGRQPSPTPTGAPLQPTSQPPPSTRSTVAAAPSATPASGSDLPAITPRPTPAGWKTYANAAYGITLQYPSDWQPKQGYDERYAGKNGFFQVSAMGAEGMTIDQAAETSAYHKLRPYGYQPRIESLQVQGHQARVIVPSDDQPAQEEGLAALIVLSPRPIAISGASYGYLVLWVDKDHVSAIADTLRFTTGAVRPAVTPKPPGSPTPVATRLTGPRSVPPSPRYESVPLIADIALEREIRAILGTDVGSYGVAVKRFADGRGAQINPERQFYAASLFKLLVMYEVFKQRSLGLLSFDDKLTFTPSYLEYQLLGQRWPLWGEVLIRELLDAMITESNNVAAMLLHDKVGGWNIIQDLRGIGLTHTDIAGDMPTSARDMAVWLEMIARGKAVDEQSSGEMIDLLTRQSVRDRLPALLPAGTKVANKTGNWENATHDVGIVYAPKGAYVIAVLSDRACESKPIAELSRLVYEHFERNAGAAQPSPRPSPSPQPTTRPAATATSPISPSPTPSAIPVKVYFSRIVNNEVEFVPVERKVSRTQAIGRAAVEELLKGPTPEEKARGLSSSIPAGARLRSLKIVGGVAYADFDEALQFQVGGSLRVMAIRKGISLTLLQFATVQSVVISIDGRTEDILQP